MLTIYCDLHKIYMSGSRQGKLTPTLCISILNSRTSLLRAIGHPTDSLQFASHYSSSWQPTLIGTPLLVRQRIKNILSTAYRFGQNLNLMCDLHEPYGRPLKLLLHFRIVSNLLLLNDNFS